MNKNKAIIFDFDGVLVDSFYANYIPATMIYGNDLTEEAYRKWFLGNIYDKKTNLKKIDKDVDFWKEYVSIISNIELKNGFADLLNYLKEDYLLFVNSSTPENVIESYLDKKGLKKIFDEITGYNLSKSKVKKFEYIIDKYNLEKENILFVTDTVGDVMEASKVELKSIVVTWGFHDKKTLAKSEPFVCVDKVEDILEFVQRYLKNNF